MKHESKAASIERSPGAFASITSAGVEAHHLHPFCQEFKK
jgi:hypothetical protein